VASNDQYFHARVNLVAHVGETVVARRLGDELVPCEDRDCFTFAMQFTAYIILETRTGFPSVVFNARSRTA